MNNWRKAMVWWFKKRKWRFAGPLPKSVRQMVIVAGPHTSRSDFLLAGAVTTLTNFRTDILVHQRLYRFPYRSIIRSLNTIPWDPANTENWMKNSLEQFNHKSRYSVVMTTRFPSDPAGTFRTAWYDLAVAANVPVVMVGLERSKRVVRIHTEFLPSGDRDRDLHFARTFFDRIH